ncbi:MAG: hypothetical protein ACI4OM_01425, partial [Evtepia sp.]
VFACVGLWAFPRPPGSPVSHRYSIVEAAGMQGNRWMFFAMQPLKAHEPRQKCAAYADAALSLCQQKSLSVASLKQAWLRGCGKRPKMHLSARQNNKHSSCWAFFRPNQSGVFIALTK